MTPETVDSTIEASSMQCLDMAEREPREQVMPRGGSAGERHDLRSDSPAMLSVIVGDCRNTLKELPSESVQCVVTSPPYWGLRDYGGQADQIGLEATSEEFVQTMVALFREVRRVLKKDGVLWLNLGDCWNAYNGGAGPSSSLSKGTQTRERPKLETGFGLREKALKPKDLIGIPWRVALALQADGWWLRQDIIWAKPNPMPESVTDRCTKSHEYIFLLTKSDRYYYDADAIAEPMVKGAAGSTYNEGKTGVNGMGRVSEKPRAEKETRNKRSVWTVPLAPYPGAHFATYPAALIAPCILAGSRSGDVVLDPFGGSGTTGATALMLGRRAVLCELNPEYAKLIEERTTTTFGLAL